MQSTYKYDMKIRHHESVTFFSDYNGTWEEVDITLEQLKEYVERGYAIKINC